MSQLFAKTSVVVTAIALAVFVSADASAAWIWDAEAGWVDMSAPPLQTDQGLYAYAKGLQVQGNYSSARDVLSELARRFPESKFLPLVRLNQARCALSLGNCSTAARMAADLLKERPAAVAPDEAASIEIQAGVEEKDVNKSIEILQESLTLAPNPKRLFEARKALAEKQFLNSQYADAEKMFSLAASEAPDKASKSAALTGAAYCDVASADLQGADMETVRNADAKLKEAFALVSEPAAQEKQQELIRLVEALLRETNPSNREIFRTALMANRGISPGQLSEFKRAARRYTGTAAGETARYYQAWSYEAEQEPWSAFKTYEQFIKEYPASARLRDVVNREFQIGRTLESEGSHGRSETVMTAVTQNNPLGPLADDAYMALGHENMRTEHFSEARMMFDMVLQNYPRSEWNSAAAYYGGVADLKNSDYAKETEQLLDSAHHSFELYLQMAPTGQFAAEAKQALQDCIKKQARDMMNKAKFYMRQGRSQAASIYCITIRKLYPDTEPAAEAEAYLRGNTEGDGNAK